MRFTGYASGILLPDYSKLAINQKNDNDATIYWHFFFNRIFSHRHWRFTGQQGKGGEHLLFHSTTSTRSQTLRHLFATLHVRWLHVFLIAMLSQSQSQLYRITIWVIDWWCNVCLFTWWIDTRLLLQRFDIGNRWIWTRVDYHHCITSEPTNQVC